MDLEITIRRAESITDYHACQDAQRRAWGITGDGYVVPVATMVGAQLHGGLVLGAFLASGEAVGVSFAFLGRLERRLCLYSQLTGVVPGYQGHGIGHKLKRFQWEFARSEGLELLAWAFDPLQAGNAHFNLSKLGATAGRYVENMYGLRTDALNDRVPTDRLIAEWATTARIAEAIGASPVEGIPRVVEAESAVDDFPGVRTAAMEPRGPTVLLEIPDEIQRMRREAPALAAEWAQAVRRGFLACFATGYRAVGFERIEDQGRRRNFYRLTAPQAAS